MTKRFGLIALLASVVGIVAIVVAASQLTGGGSSGPIGGSGMVETEVSLGEEPAPDSALVPGERTGDDGLVTSEGAVGGGEQIAPPLPDVAVRKLVREASLSLGVEDVPTAVQRVESIATGAGGFVSSSSVFVDDGPEPLEGDDVAPAERTRSASVTIRVPSSAFSSVMSQLRDIADDVRSERSSTTDVTEEFTDLQARLRNLEATEARYLELLDQAESIPDILTVQDRLNAVRLEIERVQGRINVLNELSDLATITVQLSPAAVVEEPSQPGWAQEAWEDAWDASKDVLQALGTASIVIGVVLAWLAVPALVIAVGWRVLRPRRPAGDETGSGGVGA